MNTQQVVIGDEVREIEVSPVTLIFHEGIFEDLKYPGLVEIDYLMSRAYYHKVDELDPIVEPLFRLVFSYGGKCNLPERFTWTKEHLNTCSDAMQALAGRLQLTLVLMSRRTKFMWKFPEAGLHPTAQCQLADVILILQDFNRLAKFLGFDPETKKFKPN